MSKPRNAADPITKEDRITSGVVDYFPNALAAIGRWSTYNNTKYPPAVPSPDGSPRWSFNVSTNHADAIASHLAQRGTVDTETGLSHSVPLAWRALALLESELIAAGAKPGLGVLMDVPAPREPRYGAFYAGSRSSLVPGDYPSRKAAVQAIEDHPVASTLGVAAYEIKELP